MRIRILLTCAGVAVPTISRIASAVIGAGRIGAGGSSHGAGVATALATAVVTGNTTSAGNGVPSGAGAGVGTGTPPRGRAGSIGAAGIAHTGGWGEKERSEMISKRKKANEGEKHTVELERPGIECPRTT